MNKEQLMHDKMLVAELEKEYNSVKEQANSLRDQVNDLSFEEQIPDSHERYLLIEKLKTIEGYQTNIINRIRFYRHRVQANETEPLYEVLAAELPCTLCGDTNALPHCGQDAHEENKPKTISFDEEDGTANQCGFGNSLGRLVGKTVVSVFPAGFKCQGCVYSRLYGEPCECDKVEMVDGAFLCLKNIKMQPVEQGK